MSAALWKPFEGQSIENTYRLGRILGVGGFGAVFLAEHVVENRFVRRVAVKLIPADTGNLDRQLTELVAATAMRHENLLACFHAGSTVLGATKLLYLVMELADRSLQSQLASVLLAPAEARALAEQIAPAIAFLHARQLVHRDIKPANVLLAGGAWKLSDFGTVRQSAATSTTQAVIGTLQYMPPESFEGVVSPAWDTWSLGMMLLESLTRRPAFEGTSDQQLMVAIVGKTPKIPDDLPAPFADIIRGCLTKDYRARWSAQRVVQALDARRSGSFRPAQPASAEPANPPPPPAIDRTIGARASTIAPAGSAASRIDPPFPPKEKAKSSRRNRVLIIVAAVVGALALLTVISAILTVPRLNEAQEHARAAAARYQINSIRIGLIQYYSEKGAYPSAAQGLSVLCELGFLTKCPLKDPWGHDYVYKYPGDHGDEPDIISLGADGQPGGDGANADIVSWTN